MGTGHYYFDEMRGSLKLGSKSAFCTHKTQYLQYKLSKSQQPQQQQCRKRENEIKIP
jgi:hypothetical protein